MYITLVVLCFQRAGCIFVLRTLCESYARPRVVSLHFSNRHGNGHMLVILTRLSEMVVR